MNQTLHEVSLPYAGHLLRPTPRDSYYNSTVDLRLGTTVSELSLGQLPTEEVAEFLRMRHAWQQH